MNIQGDILLFPYGTDGWHMNLKLQNGKKLTALVYHHYHIMVRQMCLSYVGLNDYSSSSAASLCSLFVMILTWCEPSSPLDIYKEAIAEDFLHQHFTQLGNADLECNSDTFNFALNDLQDKVLSMADKKLSEYGLPQPQTVDNDRLAWEYSREIYYDQGEQQAYVDHNVSLLTADQQDVYDYFCMIDRNEGGMVFRSFKWNR